MSQRSVVVRFTLKAWDIFCYFVGMCVRIQTIVLGYILFFVETSNVCIVVDESDKPIPTEVLPVDLNTMPGGFDNCSQAFQLII